jgi:hypothetical protein
MPKVRAALKASLAIHASALGYADAEYIINELAVVLEEQFVFREDGGLFVAGVVDSCIYSGYRRSHSCSILLMESAIGKLEDSVSRN